ncbi:MAG: DUF4190 domain-containing protein [Verrucomicrobiota bacterium]
MEPHRGTTVLVLGILGLVVCQVCGIIAWVMANKDIPKMESGAMDPEGLGQTKAGKICGIISVILLAVILVIYILMFVVFGAAAASGALDVAPTP